ncbi:hypothetical protein ERO13_D08G133265v2 [Gossypium hirsutum]|nr:hypothetical protein ERO13_D08G133265v2 [Gossypium hirsutum]
MPSAALLCPSLMALLLFQHVSLKMEEKEQFVLSHKMDELWFSSILYFLIISFTSPSLGTLYPIWMRAFSPSLSVFEESSSCISGP